MSNYNKNDLVTGEVTGIETYGVFLSFENGYSGLIHISELSEHFVSNVEEYAQIGDKIPCKILDVDESCKKLKCSIRNTEYGIKKDMEIDHGFAPLKKQLPIWMEEKLEKMGMKDKS